MASINDIIKSLVGATDTLWTGYAMRGSQSLVKSLVARAREKARGLYRKIWTIYNNPDKSKGETFEAALRVAIIPIDFVTKFAPLPTEVKELVNDMLSDVVNEVRRNFVGAPALELADGETPETVGSDDDIKTLAVEFVNVFPHWVRRLHSSISKLADRVGLMELAGKKFSRESFKAFRSVQQALSPEYAAKFDRLWQRGASTQLTQAQRRWALMESSEYLESLPGLRALLDQTDEQQDIWLAQNSHDKWFNLPPQVVDFLKKIGPQVGTAAGELARQLHTYNEAASQRRNTRWEAYLSPENLNRHPERWRHIKPEHPLWPERCRRERHRRNWRIAHIGLASYTGLTIVAFVTGHPAIGATMSGVPVLAAIMLLIGIAITNHREGVRHHG